jgi:amylosucrase
MVFGFGGIPLLYMGDEIGMANDESFLTDPSKAEDNRWIHRPAMAWAAAEKAMQKLTASSAPSTQVAYRIRSGVQHLITLRQTLPSLHAAVATEVRAGRSRGVAIFDRHHPAGHLVQVYNLSDTDQFVDTNELGGLYGTVHDHITGHTFDIGAGMPLAPYEVRWLTRG